MSLSCGSKKRERDDNESESDDNQSHQEGTSGAAVIVEVSSCASEAPKSHESSVAENENEPLPIEIEEVDSKARFSSTENDEDIEIVLDSGSSYYAHLAILSQWTPYFKTNSTHNGRDLSKMKHIKLEGVDDDALLAFLVKVYPPCDLVISDANVTQLFEVAVRVDAVPLTKMCVATLEELEPTMELAVLADKYQKELGNLNVATIEWMAVEFDEVGNDERFNQLSKETILEVVKLSKDYGVQQEPPTKKKRFWFF